MRDGLVRGVARTGLGRQRRGLRGARSEEGGGADRGRPRPRRRRDEAMAGHTTRRGAGGPRHPPQADTWRRSSIVRSALRAHRCPRRRLPHAPWGSSRTDRPWHSRAIARLTAPPDWDPLRSAADWKEHRGGVLVVHQRNPLGNENRTKYHGRNCASVTHRVFLDGPAARTDNSESLRAPNAASARTGGAVHMPALRWGRLTLPACPENRRAVRDSPPRHGVASAVQAGARGAGLSTSPLYAGQSRQTPG